MNDDRAATEFLCSVPHLKKGEEMPVIVRVRPAGLPDDPTVESKYKCKLAAVEDVLFNKDDRDEKEMVKLTFECIEGEQEGRSQSLFFAADLDSDSWGAKYVAALLGIDVEQVARLEEGVDLERCIGTEYIVQVQAKKPDPKTGEVKPGTAINAFWLANPEEDGLPDDEIPF